MPAVATPSLDGKGEYFANFAGEPTWMLRKGTLLSYNRWTQRRAMFVWTWAATKLLEPDGAVRIAHVSHYYFALNAIDPANKGVVRFLHFKRTAQTMGESRVRFDSLRRKAE